MKGERSRKAFLTLLLTVGAVPMLLPFVWLLLSSVKSADRVLTETPEWLPWEEERFVEDRGREIPVRILDDARERDLGIVRILPRDRDRERPFRWPVRELEATAAEIVSVRVEGEWEAARVVGVRGGKRLCALVERALKIPVTADGFRQEKIERFFFEAFGRKFTLRPGGGDTWRVEKSAVFPVSSDRIRNGRLRLPFGIELSVETTRTFRAAGVSFVRFRAEETRLPPGTVQREVRMRYRARFQGRWVPARRVRLGPGGEVVEAELVGEHPLVEAESGDIRFEKRKIFFIEILGQKVCVDTIGSPDEKGLAAVQSRPLTVLEARALGLTGGRGYGVFVSPDRIHAERHLDFRFENYVEIFRRQPNFFGAVLNSLFLAAVSIVGNVLSCGLVGYAFARLRFPGRGFLFVLVLATMMLPVHVTMIPLFIGWVKVGALDTYVPLTLPAFLANSAFFIFLYRQFFLSVPPELEEAARVDGCGPVRRFWEIVFPLAKPAAVAVAVFTFMGSWNDFLGPLLYLTSEEREPLALALYSFKTTFGYKQAHFVMAASSLMTAPTILLFLLAQRVFMRGVVVTGLKG